MTAEPTTNVVGVPLLRTGTWPTSTGTFTFTTADLEAAVSAAKSPAMRAPVVKIGHLQQWSDGQPALGNVENLRIESGGTALVGDLVGVPSWLAGVMASAYPSRSIEGQFDHVDTSGRTHRFALTALALLGATEPAIGALPSLSDVQKLYPVAASAGPVAIYCNASQEEDMDKVAAVRAAFYANPAYANVWIEEVCDGVVIAVDDTANKVLECAYTLADGTVTFGPSREVSREYVAAASVSRRSLVVYASADESRKLTVQDSVTPDTNALEFSADDMSALCAAVGAPDWASPSTIINTLQDRLGHDAEDTVIASSPDRLRWSPTQVASLCGMLGLKLPTTVPAILAAVRRKVGSAKTADQSAGESGVNASTGVFITRDEHARLVAAAADGQNAAAAAKQAEIGQFVLAAVQDGRIIPAKRQMWCSLIEKDPDSRRTLASLPKGLAWPGQEIGHAGEGPATLTPDDQLMEHLFGSVDG